MSATAKNFQYAKAPAVIRLLGDPTLKPESAEHIIEFPGGAIEVARTSDNRYWVHVIVNHGQALEDSGGRQGARGKITAARMDTSAGVADIPGAAESDHIAFLIGVVAP